MLFIFDWDDTLFPTLSLNKIRDKKTYFNILSKHIITLFNKCLNHGKIIIISNANTAWFKYCLTNFMPNLLSYIINKKIIFISAREMSYKLNIETIYWKKYTFNNIIPKFIENYKTDKKIISIGDSDLERKALLEYNDKTLIKKSIKLLTNPHPINIYLQLNDINKLFNKLILNNNKIDIIIKKK
jgi:hypothetical protein